jgi:hypothetical protein
VALKTTTYEQEFERASTIIEASRNMTHMLMSEGFIPEAPPEDGMEAATDFDANEAY